MGDVGEAFKAFNEIKSEERSKKEPGRWEYAENKIRQAGFLFQKDVDALLIYVPKGTITFFPWTGWFQGQKPYGRINGRGINVLIKHLSMLTQSGEGK